MKKQKILIQIGMLAFFFLLALLLSTAGKRGQYIDFAGFTQGSTYRITYESRKGIHLQKDIDSLLLVFDHSLSIYKPGSIISKFNRNIPGTKADDLFTEVFNKSHEVNKKTGGAFDITVGPIVNAMGFGSSDTLNVDSTLIDSLKTYVGMEKIRLENGMLIKTDTAISIDVNAIAQGYSVDVISAFLESKNIRNYLVEVGGEIRARGKNKYNQVWRIGIDKPEEGNVIPGAELQAIVRLKNQSLATSGNYRKFYVKNGVKFVHTINPATGYPVISNLLSATVVADDCMTADAYATALMVFGLEKSIDFLKENNFLQAYLVYSDDLGNYKVYVTPGLKKALDE